MTIDKTTRSSSTFAATAALLSLLGCVDPQAELESDLSSYAGSTGLLGTVNLDTSDARGAAGFGSPEDFGEPPHELDEAALQDLALEGYDLPGSEIEIDLSTVREDMRAIRRADVPLEVLAELDRDTLIQKVRVGAEDRTPVANTRINPYKTVVRIFTRYAKGEDPWGCTGSMIGPDAVLTAAHCVFNSRRTSPGYAYSVTVVPGLYLKSPVPSSGVLYKAPFGSASGGKLFVPQRYRDNERTDWDWIPHDYAIIRLKSSLGNAGVRPIAVMPSPLKMVASMIAYHGDKEDGLRMYVSHDQVRKVLDNGTFNHYIDMTPGASGAGITGGGEGWENKIFGINSAEITGATPYNIGVLISTNNYRVLIDWAVRPL